MIYFKEINNIFKFTNIIKNSIIYAFFILVIDYLNIPSIFLSKDYFLSFAVLCFLLIMITLELCINKKFSLIISKNINILDKNLFITLFSLLFYSIYLVSDVKIYKLYILISLSLISFCLLLWRYFYIKTQYNKRREFETNTYDLKQFLEKDFFEEDNDNLILLKESDVNYDLLHRDIFVDYITSLICSCSPDGNFVFSLNGAWGNGKSTILNLFEAKINSDNSLSDEIIVINDFDPWKYNDNLTLFRGFYDSITKNKNFNIDYSLYKKFYNIYKVLILGNDNIFNNLDIDLHFTNNTYTIDEIKKSISSYIKLTNKKVVFIIDNIDRLNKDQILMIFKTISTLFDFDNFIYLLSFDEERIKKVFKEELNIDPNYLNKIINTSINLPYINSSLLIEIAHNILIKLFEAYDIDYKINTSYEDIFKKLAICFKDIREIKRFSNYISTFMNSKEFINQINIYDLVIIKLIQFLNPYLYDKIHSNPYFFISEDFSFSPYTDKNYSIEKFNEKSKEFYDEFFIEDIDHIYRDALSLLFPYIHNYSINDKIISSEFYYQDYDDSIINKNISNGLYFEYYFEFTPNRHNNLLKKVTTFIDEANVTKDIKEIEHNYISLLSSDLPNQHLIFLFFNNYIKNIKKKILPSFIDIIYNNINILNMTNLIDLQKYSIMVLSNIFAHFDEEQAKHSISDFITKTKKLDDLDVLISWLESASNKKYSSLPYNNNFSEIIYSYAKDKFLDKLNNIIDNNIDIISNTEYGDKPILILYKYSIYTGKIKKYINKHLNKNNIFKFLDNFILQFVTDEYPQNMNVTILYELIDRDTLNDIIDSVDYNLNFEQQFILDMYNSPNTHI